MQKNDRYESDSRFPRPLKRDTIQRILDSHRVASRGTWKPMHPEPFRLFSITVMSKGDATEGTTYLPGEAFDRLVKELAGVDARTADRLGI